MDYYTLIIKIIDTNIVHCLIPMLFTLTLVNRYFKKRFDAKKALYVVSRFIIVYTLIISIRFIWSLVFDNNQTVFLERFDGPYYYIRFMMLFSSMILPFSLLVKKMASRFWYVIVIAYFMKLGFYMEYKIILTTSFHRDFLDQRESLLEYIYPSFVVVLQGVFMAIVLLVIINFIKHKNYHNDIIDELS